MKMPRPETGKRKIKDYRPFGRVYGKNAFDKNGNRNIFYYERNWFCNENKIIHRSEKETLNCPYCSKIWE